ncbi:hypothetical protein ABZ208_30230 [Streptomyces sp. NPDC006208]|uniref:hypothetical protein n=1 Tax=Streptomyces sp. NPDC006208 TaxID=3156734 RepID=UPI0033A8D3FE
MIRTAASGPDTGAGAWHPAAALGVEPDDHLPTALLRALRPVEKGAVLACADPAVGPMPRGGRASLSVSPGSTENVMALPLVLVGHDVPWT